MPYILHHTRNEAYVNPKTAGELNYALSMRMIAAFQNGAHPLSLNAMSGAMRGLLRDYLSRNPLEYGNINEVLGAVAGAVMEFRRRIKPHPLTTIKAKLIARTIGKVVDDFYAGLPATYEDEKIVQNGDIGYESL